MTDPSRDTDTWVPRVGLLAVSNEHAELLKGLYQLAAWIVDHPELPLPTVNATFFPRGDSWEAKCALVDQVAVALGVAPQYRTGGAHYLTEASFGPVRVASTAITAEHLAAWDAHMSYSGSVLPGERDDDAAGGAR
jgi:hypothetical protein